jgi:hypothetical protein
LTERYLYGTISFMTTPNPELQPDRALLPVVSPHTLQSVSAEFSQDGIREAEVLDQMTAENPYLANGLSNAIVVLGRGDEEHTRNILTAVTMLYNCLRTQAEADAMKNDFGIGEPEEFAD